MLFDKIAFEDQGFDFGIYDNPFEVSDLGYEASNADTVSGGILKITSDTAFETKRLADVKNGPIRTPIDIAAWLARKVLQLFLDHFRPCVLYCHRRLIKPILRDQRN